MVLIRCTPTCGVVAALHLLASSNLKGFNMNPTNSTGPMSPGDDAPVGTPGTGESICPTCGGNGKHDGKTCETCDGTGKVNKGIGGA